MEEGSDSGIDSVLDLEAASLEPVLERRPSTTATTQLLDDFARTSYNVEENLKQIQTMSNLLGGATDSHDNRAKLYW